VEIHNRGGCRYMENAAAGCTGLVEIHNRGGSRYMENAAAGCTGLVELITEGVVAIWSFQDGMDVKLVEVKISGCGVHTWFRIESVRIE